MLWVTYLANCLLFINSCDSILQLQKYVKRLKQKLRKRSKVGSFYSIYFVNNDDVSL